MTLDPTRDSKVGDIMNDAYFRPHTTGGGCMAWRLDSKDETHYALITDEDGTTLGHDVEDPATYRWCVGIYDAEGEDWKNGYITGLDAAIKWCEGALRLPNPVLADLPRDTALNVYNHFSDMLGRDPADETLRDLPIESNCGADCVKLIDAAFGLLALCDPLAHREITTGVEHAISIKWHG